MAELGSIFFSKDLLVIIGLVQIHTHFYKPM